VDKFVCVLQNKTQLIIPITIGQICLGITHQDTTNNSNSNWIIFVGITQLTIPIGQIYLRITQEDTTKNSN
jgi:hypothetical protein